MATKREKLEAKAEELGLSYVPSTTDDELQSLINDFQNNDESDRDFKYFKSTISGLSIQIGDEPGRDEIPQEVRFKPYNFFDEEKGDHYQLGLLRTDEPDAIEVMDDDPNVTEITQDEYEQLIENSRS